MKIKKKTLVEFLKKVNMQGNEKIDEAIFNFTEQGLKISALTTTKVSRLDAILNMGAFIEYSAIGKVGIQNISTIIKIVSKFGDEIELAVEGNIIKIKDSSKEMSTELIDTQFIPEVAETKNFEFDETFTIEASKIQEIIADASINSDFNLTFTTMEKALKISSSGKYKFATHILAEEAKGGVEVTFGDPLVNVVSALTSKLQVSMKSNFPIKIMEKTDDSIITIICSPKILNK